MRFQTLAGRLFNTPLLVRGSYARTVAAVLGERMGVSLEIDGQGEYQEREPYSPMLDRNGIMTVPVVGGLYARGDSLDASSGAQSYSNLMNIMVEAMENREVKGILLDIDSPGGEAGGCFSFADSIKAMSKIKPIWGIANTDAASAAYAILASCDRAIAPRDAQVGSIGVVMLHVDFSQQLENAGIVTTYIYQGSHKVDGSPYKALSDQAAAEFGKKISQRYDQFVSLVASQRSISEDEVRDTEARMFLADEALELGLIDDVLSFEETRQLMAREVKPKSRVHVLSNGSPVTIHESK